MFGNQSKRFIVLNQTEKDCGQHALFEWFSKLFVIIKLKWFFTLIQLFQIEEGITIPPDDDTCLNNVK